MFFVSFFFMHIGCFRFAASFVFIVSVFLEFVCLV